VLEKQAIWQENALNGFLGHYSVSNNEVYSDENISLCSKGALWKKTEQK
jgi:hypothetical protein